MTPEMEASKSYPKFTEKEPDTEGCSVLIICLLHNHIILNDANYSVSKPK